MYATKGHENMVIDTNHYFDFIIGSTDKFEQASKLNPCFNYEMNPLDQNAKTN
jgi:hypothetical protein